MGWDAVATPTMGAGGGLSGNCEDFRVCSTSRPRCLPQVLAVLILRDLLLGRAFGGGSRAPTIAIR